MTTPYGAPRPHEPHAHPVTDQAHPADADAVSGQGVHAPGHDAHDDAGTLGPIAWRMWLVGVIGVIAALAVVACAVVATGFTFFDLVA